MELSTDIAQDTFLKLWKKQLNYDEKKIKSLLYKIARNQFIDHKRRQKKEAEYLSEMKFQFSPGFQDNGLVELKENYERALLTLTEKQRVVFLMSRNENLKYSEIAGRLKISIKSVEKRMSKAILNIKQAMKI